MNPEQIRKLDLLLGTPSCFLLTLVEKIRRINYKPTPPKRILFIKLIEMGSTVLASPAFHEATQMVGKDNMFILVFAQNRPIVDILPYFKAENILTIDDSNIRTFAGGLIRAMAKVRKENIDTAIDMEGLTRSSAIITWLTGSHNRVGFHNFTSEGPYRGRLFTHEMNFNFQHHISEMFLSLVKAAARTPKNNEPVLKELINEQPLRPPLFVPSENDTQIVRSLLKKHNIDPGKDKIILINPNCSDLLPLRRWPVENFIELGNRILADIPDSALVITGAPAEQHETDKIITRFNSQDRVISLAGKTTLTQLLALYSMSKALISNDSGPCHFAALTNISIIALFGPETPLLYSPLSPNVNCITSNLTCSPCVNMLNHRFSPCKDNLCMQLISVEQVYKNLCSISKLTQ